MGIYNSSSSSSSSSNSSNVNLLARLIYGEARGEPYTGQVAVGAVVMNRVRNSSFPNSISGVIYQSGAFDAVRDGQINLTPDSTAKKSHHIYKNTLFLFCPHSVSPAEAYLHFRKYW